MTVLVTVAVIFLTAAGMYRAYHALGGERWPFGLRFAAFVAMPWIFALTVVALAGLLSPLMRSFP